MLCVGSSSGLLTEIARYVPYNIKFIYLLIFCVAFWEKYRLSSRSSIVFPAFVDDRIKNLPYKRFISTGMVWLAIVWACHDGGNCGPKVQVAVWELLSNLSLF